MKNREFITEVLIRSIRNENKDQTEVAKLIKMICDVLTNEEDVLELMEIIPNILNKEEKSNSSLKISLDFIKDSDGNTLLHNVILSEKRNINFTRMLLEMGANPNEKNIHNITPFISASRIGNTSETVSYIKLLQNFNATLNGIDKEALWRSLNEKMASKQALYLVEKMSTPHISADLSDKQKAQCEKRREKNEIRRAKDLFLWAQTPRDEKPIEISLELSAATDKNNPSNKL